jgi:hypothetical protein
MSGLCENNRCEERALTGVTLTHVGNGTLGHIGGGKRCEGDPVGADYATHCSGRYRAEGCVAPE